MAGIYIHIPFCQSRCIYCDFFSTIHNAETKSQYLFALEREIKARQNEYKHLPSASLYIGGGTPSQLPPQMLRQLFHIIHQHFTLAPNAEITIEANPEDITPAWLNALRQTPTNRISMGVQTFHNPTLALLKRRHNAQQAIHAVNLCRQAGYTNLSIDLIFGLPGQTLQHWKEDLHQAAQLHTPHLSAYALQYEPGTALHALKEQGKVSEADEELSVEMYTHLCHWAKEQGLQHYEISNFAQPGKQAVHNTGYWQQKPYCGFGPGAHSYDGQHTRRWNLPNLHAYLHATNGLPPHNGETLTPDEKYNETVFTRLRTADGLPLALLNPKNQQYCLQMAAPHLRSGKMLLDDHHLRLKEDALFVFDDIVSDLMH